MCWRRIGSWTGAVQREADRREKEHRFAAAVAIAAIAAAILAIIAVRVAYVGSKDVAWVIAPEMPGWSRDAAKPELRGKERSLRYRAEREAAKSRWATGFSPEKRARLLLVHPADLLQRDLEPRRVLLPVRSKLGRVEVGDRRRHLVHRGAELR